MGQARSGGAATLSRWSPRPPRLKSKRSPLIGVDPFKLTRIELQRTTSQNLNEVDARQDRGRHERAKAIESSTLRQKNPPTSRLGASHRGPGQKPNAACDLPTLAGAGQGPESGAVVSRHLRIPRRLITSRYFFRSCSRRYFSRLDRFETIISSPRRLAWSLACVLK
jgi:hypothetical protein